jgi:YihY family inner membrane protein
MPDPKPTIKERYQRARKFIVYDIWHIGKPGEDIPSGILVKQLRVLVLLLTKLLDGQLMLRASALTFATLLSIVPFLAVIFYIIQTFNLGEEVYANIQLKLENAIVVSAEKMPGFGKKETDEDQELAPDSPDQAIEPSETLPIDQESVVPPADTAPQEESSENSNAQANAPPINTNNQALKDRLILQFSRGVGQQNEDMENPMEWLVELSNTLATLADEAAKNKAAFGISTILLIITTVFGLMKNIEKSFNSVWGVRRTRSWYRMMSDYLVITICLPFVMAGVLGVTAALKSDRVLEALGPLAMLVQSSQFIIIIIVFSSLYYIVPNTRVRLGYALFGGIISGSLWVFLSWSYIHFQVGLAKYQAVLSVFAQFPLLLVWIYSSWAIMLFGSEITYAYQNEKTFALERFADKASFAYRAALGIRAMIDMGHRFQNNLAPLDISTAAEEWNVPSRLLNATMEQLEESGFIIESASAPNTYQPARPLEKITAGEILKSIHERGEDPSQLLHDDAYQNIFEEYLNPNEGIHAKTIAELITRVSATLTEASDAG